MHVAKFSVTSMPRKTPRTLVPVLKYVAGDRVGFLRPLSVKRADPNVPPQTLPMAKDTVTSFEKNGA